MADRASALELRAVVGNRIPVRVAPTPELDEVLESVAESFPGPGSGEGRQPSYLENGRIAPETVAALFAAAESLHRASPWTVVTDDQVLRLDIPAYDVEGACLTIIGNLGESFGFLVFPSSASYRTFVALAGQSFPPEGGRLDFGTSWLALDFERAADLPESMRREVAAHAWPVAAANAYPRVARIDHDGTPFPNRRRDLEIAAATAAAFARFFAAHRDLFESDDVEPIFESCTVLDGVEVRLTVAPAGLSLPPGRGAELTEPGSGPAEEVAGHPIHVLDRALVTELETFAFTRFGDRWLKYLDDFFDATEAVQLASPWPVFHFRKGRETALEAFLESPPRPLSPDERSWLESQRAAWLSVWEVVGVEPGASLRLRNLLSGEERFVNESEGSKTLVLRDTVLGRVVDHDEDSFLCSVHPRPLSPRDADEVVRRARRWLRLRRRVPVASRCTRAASPGRGRPGDQAPALRGLARPSPPRPRRHDPARDGARAATDPPADASRRTSAPDGPASAASHPRIRSPRGSSTGSWTSLASRRSPRISMANSAPPSASSTGANPSAMLLAL